MVDVFGLKSMSEAGKTIIEKGLCGIETFLQLTCVPVLEELGLMARDKIRNWRLCNIIKIIEKAKGKLEYDGNELQLTANARVGLQIVEYGSLTDNDVLQEMWAGLFVSSCSEEETDDVNLTYVYLLNQLTVNQAKLIRSLCKNCKPVKFDNGSVGVCKQVYSVDKLLNMGEYKDFHVLDRDVDYLENIGLINGGINAQDFQHCKIYPTTLCLNLFVTCESKNKTICNFWDKYITEDEYMQNSELRPPVYLTN